MNVSHGTVARYRAGCGCLPCRAASAAYRRGIREQPSKLVDPGPARERIAQLAAMGVGWKRVAALARLTPSTVSSVLYDRPARPRSVRISRYTAAAILSVTPQRVLAERGDGRGTRLRAPGDHGDASGDAVADAGGVEPERRGVGGVVDGPAGSGEGEGPEREWDRDAVGDGGADVADSDGVGSVRGGSARGWRRGSADDDLGAAADTDGAGPQGRRVSGRAGAPVVGDGASAAAAAVCDGREGHEECDERQEAGQRAPLGGDAAGRVLDWAGYEPAVRRWELILGRSAPSPTQTGKRGGQQLSPAFVEWLMGLPAGHVTEVPELSRNEQLKMLGNGVVPQQAELALRSLLAVETAVVAA